LGDLNELYTQWGQGEEESSEIGEMKNFQKEFGEWNQKKN
jgi:hypothetical protein